MAQALRLAECGLYTTTPNPRVGCVIVNDGNQRYFESAMGRNWAAGVNVSYQF